jgi:uncharacterized protein
MTLTDAGALVALLDADDPYHTACVTAAQCLPAGPLLTTWVCFTEAMYLLGSVGGYRYQAALWSLRAAGRVVLHDLTPAEADRMAALMAPYQDTPMDLADASLVVWLQRVGPCIACSLRTRISTCTAWRMARHWKWCRDLATTFAGIEVIAIGTGATVADGVHGLVVRDRQMGIALDRLWSVGGEDVGKSHHDASPRMTAWMRCTASSCPFCVRCREIIVVASWAWPMECCMARRLTPAASRWVAEACRGVLLTPP